MIMECWRKCDFCWVEVNLATLTCWGYYQILDVGLSVISFNFYNTGVCVQTVCSANDVKCSVAV